MTNYMGKRRLTAILLQMLSDHPELQAQVKKDRDSLEYATYRGSEWLRFLFNDDNDDYNELFLYTYDAPSKLCKEVTFEENRINSFGNVVAVYNRIVTKYNENFEPFPLATLFCGFCELRKHSYYPFQPEREDPAYNFDEASGLNPDMFVCYDIAKRAKTSKVGEK